LIRRQRNGELAPVELAVLPLAIADPTHCGHLALQGDDLTFRISGGGALQALYSLL
jgi:hypothetical protein